jgi:NaMN:DMB phosphoribosyltransferase
MQLALVAGTTRTADVDGLGATDATPERRRHTPSTDAELVRYGRLVRTSAVPTGPGGCPTPALVTRAAVALLGLDVVVCDGGLSEPTGAPTVGFGAKPGRDIRDPDPVPTAPGAFTAAREFAGRLASERLVVGETIPGGTTTALAVMRALGEPAPVPSLPDDRRQRQETVVDEALSSADLDPGGAAHHPELALRFVGDPTLSVVAGLCAGALESGTRVTLAGGTPLVAAGALVRHAGLSHPLELATTSSVAAHVDLDPAVSDLSLDLTVTDPGFDDDRLAGDAPAGRDGVAMGGALALAASEGVLDAVEARTLTLLERLTTDATDRESARGP